ncbi:MAG: hypothetical protein K9J16_18325 [Melioribacteraceae bacterium]|nr:hypothetical protein [Melioribacteraceae bacterium]MCF8356849.1 hypothetical protein [Melioribacteraceae bacterium]MCF8396228.1 hypothetical protein [Melioribacteraceae bacterium]MCF8421151.1 hypothetical protein [Melioribacteraceae bacterium]
MNYELRTFPKLFRQLIAAYLIVLSIGVTMGLAFVMETTDATPKGTIERFNGSQLSDDDFDIQEKYPKSTHELLMTTHNHIIGFSFIFITMGLIFYFSQSVNRSLKKFIIIEPFLSIILTFGSIWGMRFVHHSFVYVIIISAILMYGSFFVMAAVSLYELFTPWKKSN